MLLKRKLNLDRFKRSDRGYIDFAILLEQADPNKREKLLKKAGEEDPDFVSQVQRLVIRFDDLVRLDEMVLTEILAKCSSKLLAFALHGSPEPFRKSLFKNLGFKEVKMIMDEEDKMGPNPSAGSVDGARKKVLKIIRGLEKSEVVVLEFAPPSTDQASGGGSIA